MPHKSKSESSPPNAVAASPSPSSRARDDLDEAGKLASVNAIAHDLAVIRAAIRHELRTIGSVIAQQRAPLAAAIEPGIAERFERLSAAYEEQSALLDELFDLTRDAFLDEPREESFRLDELIDRLNASFAGVARSRSAQLSCSAPPLTVVADRRKLMRLLTNLLFNAIRHSAAHNIHLAAESRDGTVELTVRDDGVGLALGANAMLAATTAPATVRKLMRVTAGGNGYYIVRRLAQRLSAQVQVGTDASGGTCISIELRCSAQAPSPTAASLPQATRRTGLAWVVEYDPDERRSNRACRSTPARWLTISMSARSIESTL